MSKKFLLPVVLSGLLLPFASCQKESAPKPASADLAGTWQLTSHQCYCEAAPLPNQAVTFTATDVTFFENGRPTRHGHYALVSAVPACIAGSTTAPTLHLDFTPANTGPQEAQYSLSGDILTLDYGSPCDAPRDTYQRINL